MVAAFLLIGLVLYPGAKNILAMRQNLYNLNVKLTEKIIPKRIFLESLEKEKQSLASDLSELTLILPNESKPPLLLATIEQAASDLSLQVGSLTYSNQPNQAEQKFVQLNFLLKGEEEKVIAYLSRLQETTPLVLIKKVSIEEETESLDNKTSASLTTQWFYEPLPKSLGEIEEPIEQINQREKEALQKAAAFKSLTLEQETTLTQPVETGKSNPF